MTTTFRNMVLGSVFTIALAGIATVPGTPFAAEPSEATVISGFASEKEPPTFDSPEKAVEAFKAALAADDFDKLAELLGLDAAKVKTDEGAMETYGEIREGVKQKLVVRDEGGDKILDIGDKLWPFPFPLAKGDDGKWAFDTFTGFEEIINRRVGENELQTIETMRDYIDAQKEYASVDHDDDGVLEYAQKLMSSEGKTDGLYWSPDLGFGDSPAGDAFETAGVLEKVKAGEGYFGYRYRILTSQGPNIAGGKFDYIINGNLIAGFGLVAWPVRYGETGVHTFVTNANGVVYQADLGNDTEKIAAGIRQFNPGDTWEVTED
ncbi:DUF2950 domain-containing protein [Sinorhizobium sp. BG8]|uniref:DUF2950 domain-containing protein n=1 Tax=Sinorhizobium sp. BG8 TaxID=2613773 RepID=UPI00193CB486|nr:DUF2950 domain-containing protein [Sinorhizobium sp. BG8]QRM54420.1 DUF2950 domain-containing protein [Sinorhizobium sp. BG8]